MKSRARTLMWWPNIDKDIEQKVKSCVPCQVSRPAPPSAPLQPWSWPDKPWSRLHLDYAGLLEIKNVSSCHRCTLKMARCISSIISNLRGYHG